MAPFYFFGNAGLMVDDSVGGEAFLAYSASVLFPVPNAPEHWPLRLQTFVSAGSLLPINQSKKDYSIWRLIWVEDIGATFGELWRRPSVGVGIGVTYRLPIARVELNFGVPVVMRQGDWSRKGFQFGVGLEFM
jgi:outer membrane protein insertion porin family